MTMKKLSEEKEKKKKKNTFLIPLQKYEVEFLLQQQWYDPRLRYANQSQYEYLNAIHHHEDIWLPDTYFIMHGDFKDPIIPMHFALRIYRNGTINYLMRFDTNTYPFILFMICRFFLFSPRTFLREHKFLMYEFCDRRPLYVAFLFVSQIKSDLKTIFINEFWISIYSQTTFNSVMSRTIEYISIWWSALLIRIGKQ